VPAVKTGARRRIVRCGTFTRPSLASGMKCRTTTGRETVYFGVPRRDRSYRPGSGRCQEWEYERNWFFPHVFNWRTPELLGRSAQQLWYAGFFDQAPLCGCALGAGRGWPPIWRSHRLRETPAERSGEDIVAVPGAVDRPPPVPRTFGFIESDPAGHDRC
jgi:hypothetical protein